MLKQYRKEEAPTMNKPIQTLELFPRYTRVSFEKTFGQQAPEFDPTTPPKFWIATPPVTAPFTTYTYYDKDPNTGQPRLNQQTLAAAIANAINLPGHAVHPAFTNDPTTTAQAITTETGQVSAVNAARLSTMETADTIANEIEHDLNIKAAVQQETEPEFQITWNTEKRRLFTIEIPGFPPANVANLAIVRYAHGVGYPGNWSLNAIGGLVWTDSHQPDGTSDPRPAVPVPMRPLNPGEHVIATPFGIEVSTDTAPPDLASISKQISALTDLVQTIAKAVIKPSK